VDPAVRHAEIVDEVMGRAGALGLLAHYCADGRRCRGRRGLPDLIVCGPYGLAWIEVKAGRDELEPDQTTWMHMLWAGGQVAVVIRERHLGDGTLDEVLDSLSRPARQDAG
jgi:hypothetical protein